jgi:hypothetical protein
MAAPIAGSWRLEPCVYLLVFSLICLGLRGLVPLAYLLVWWGVLCKKPQYIDDANRLGEIVCAPIQAALFGRALRGRFSSSDALDEAPPRDGSVLPLPRRQP